jgi:signal transduction histidine kinase
MTQDPGTKLLIFDDLSESRRTLEASIRDDVYSIHAAASGEQALSLLREHEFALAILDLQAPGVNGPALAEAIRGMARTRHLPIVFVSAPGRDLDFEFAGRETGVVDVLYTPLDARVVRSKVRVFVELYQQRHVLKRQLAAIEEARRRQQLLATELQGMQAELQRALQGRDEFMSMVVHELRTPLSVLAMEGRVRQHQLAADNAAFFATENLGRMLERDERQVRSLSRLVDDLLDASRIHHGQLSIRRERCDLAAMLRRVVAEVSSRHDDAPIALVADVDSLVGEYDEFRLEQVVVNLLTNALRYGANQPIDVRLEPLPDAVAIRVKDRGVGIAPEDQARIFEQFVRVGDRKRANGLGLGLYISRRLVEAHAGTIRVESAPGEGATFTVTLPAAETVEA